MKLLEPIKVKHTEFKNRVMMSPMCMYSVEKQDGVATEFSLCTLCYKSNRRCRLYYA